MNKAIIGALRVTLGADTVAFEKGMSEAQRHLVRTQKKFQAVGRKMQTIGAGMTVGLTAPLLALGKASYTAGVQHAEAMAQVEAGLNSMGDAAGKNLKQLKDQALQLESLSTFNADDVLKTVTANMLTFGNISGEAFDRAQAAALDLSTRLDQDLKSSTIQIGKALNDPIAGITALSRVGIQFTQDQKDMIKGMVAAGDVASAQSLILNELERQYKGSAKAARDAAPGSDTIDAMRKFKRVIGELALKIIPPFTDALTRVLNAFNALDPTMQKSVVIAGAVVAAIGPLIGLVGTLTTVFMTSLGPIGLVLGALAGMVLVYKDLSPAILSTKKAREDLNQVIGKGYIFRKEEIATTLSGAQSQLAEAEAIRENIKARLEQQRVILAKQAKSLTATASNPLLRNTVGRSAAKKMAETALSIKAANDEIARQDAHIAKIEDRVSSLGGVTVSATSSIGVAAVSAATSAARATENQKTSVVKLTEAQKAANQAMLDAQRAAERAEERHLSTVESVNAEIEANKLLVEALKVSQHEYDITLEKIQLLKDGFAGGESAARAMAESLVLSRNALGSAQSASQTASNQSLLPKGAKIATRQQVDEFGKRVSSTLSGGIKAVINGNFKSFLADKLSSAASRMFDGALGGLSSGLGGILQGLMGGGGGLGGIIGSVFAGFFDKGGNIPSGKFGIVGERGPEIVRAGMGGLNVTSRLDTARMMGSVANDTGPARMTNISQTFSISGVDTKAAFAYADKKSKEVEQKVPSLNSRENQRRQRATAR